MAFIIKPLVTEKMTKITDKSSVAKSYVVKKDKKDRKGNVRVAAGTTVNLPVQQKFGFIVKPGGSSARRCSRCHSGCSSDRPSS